MKFISLLSGGMDSTTLLAELVTEHTPGNVEALSIHYGQRHAKELDAAARIADHYGVRHTIIDLSVLREHLTGSSLTDDIAVPDGHYAEETMRITVVPNRNLIMLAVAGGLAVARQADIVAAAVHAGDHFIYPDCRPEFIRAARMAIDTGTAGFGPEGNGIDVFAPFLHRTKAWIAARGVELGAPMSMTWSCYKGGDLHCGTCGTCVERHEAFDLAGIEDPTAYQVAAFDPAPDAHLEAAYEERTDDVAAHDD